MYAVTSTPLDKRTRATLRSAEFGFLGVVVYTLVQTPRRWGEPFSAGVLVLVNFELRPWRTSCWMVGTRRTSFVDELSPALDRDLCAGPCNVMALAGALTTRRCRYGASPHRSSHRQVGR